MTDFEIKTSDAGVILENKDWFESFAPEQNWIALAVGPGALLLRNRAQNLGTAASSVLYLTPELLRGLLFSLMQRQWSGVVGIDGGVGLQKLFFSEGDLVFASSTLMDHRLGEVIYRNGLISLEKLTESTIKVTRSQKFGQVLLKGGTFKAVDLWDALRHQVEQIVRSLFLSPEMVVEIGPGRDLAPTSVVFEDGGKSLIDEAFYFGLMQREFVSQMDFQSEVRVIEKESQRLKITPGTFLGDIVELAREHRIFAKILEASKLHESQTISVILEAVNRGLMKTGDLRHLRASSRVPVELQAKLDIHSFLVRSVQAVFVQHSVELPTDELREFALRLNACGVYTIFLSEDGDLHPMSIKWMASQCAIDASRAHFLSQKLEALSQFMLQISGDLLPFEASKQLRSEFKNLRV